MKKPFLRFLAEEYVKHADLSDYCFVFPNRRSGKFFEKELTDCATGTILTPEITTIDNFVTELTGAIEANRIEALVTLFNAYKSLAPDNAVEFDKFAHWGDVILNDFGDVDRYMVDARQAFFNISELKAIKSNYLTKEVKEVLSHFFNLRYSPDDEEKFWQHIETRNGEVEIKKEYITIWDLLWPLYNKFITSLAEQELTYNGKKYRDAAIRVENMDDTEFEFKKYVFAGFNMLSASEHKLFAAMQKKGNAVFYWDYNSPAFEVATNKATLFMSQYIKEFPQPISEPQNTTLPQNIFAIGVPSNYAQARYASSIVQQLVSKGLTDSHNAINTALVLPDEQLFMPVLKSIDSNIVDNINVTMGLSIRNSSISSLMSIISRLYYQAKKVKGVWSYFHADVKDVLLHPIVRFWNQTEAMRLINEINSHNTYQVTYATIAEFAPHLAPLFKEVNELSLDEVSTYINNILDFTANVLKRKSMLENKVSENSEHDNAQQTDSHASVISVEQAFLNSYYDALSQINNVLKETNVLGDSNVINISTFCFLIDRLVASTKVAFEGEPLGGLQIMGILETRCLDFKNLIILSMNERVFPRKHFTKSFIPQRLRMAFGMSTIEHQESMYAYYFYRMISRAENVYMLYDSRTQNLGAGEKSRFINQLQTLFSGLCTVKTILPALGIQAPQHNPIVVNKDLRIMNIINLFGAELPNDQATIEQRIKNGSLKLLSAHSINTYIDCPLHFYLHYVEGLAEIDPDSEFMLPSTFGTIVHDSIQQIYCDGTTIDKAFIENLLNTGNTTIDKVIVANINRLFLHKGDNCLDPLFGESKLKFDIAKQLILRILNHDKKLIEKHGAIHYIQGEKVLTCSLPLGNGKSFNLTFTIDRLDCMTINGENVHRVVDYKTGKDKVNVKDVNSLTNPNASERAHAILQLLLYCKALAQQPEFSNAKIMPVIYKLLEIDKSGLSIGNKQVTFSNTDTDDVNNLFYTNLQGVLQELFDINTPFTQTSKKENCKYCKFKDFCRRE
ncbi:MAG: PD-(D/E)XK nuclease family protein [Muribaculaceae bacterium]